MRYEYASITKKQAIEAINAISGVYTYLPESVIAVVNAKGQGCVIAVHAVLAIADIDIGLHWPHDSQIKYGTCDLTGEARGAIRRLYSTFG